MVYPEVTFTTIGEEKYPLPRIRSYTTPMNFYEAIIQPLDGKKTLPLMKIGKELYSKYNDLEIHFSSRRKLRIRSNDMTTINNLVKSDLRMSFKITIPPELVETKAVVEIPADEELSEKYIFDNLEIRTVERFGMDSGNTQLLEVRRFTKPDGQNGRVNIDLVQLTFSGRRLPSRVCLNKIIFPVKPFIERISQCTKCWRFGHLTKSCRRSKAVCYKCGSTHDGICERSTICINCSKFHDAKYQYCDTRVRLNKEAKEKAYERLPSEYNLGGPRSPIGNTFSLNLGDFPVLSNKRRLPDKNYKENIKRGRNIEPTNNTTTEKTSTEVPITEITPVTCPTVEPNGDVSNSKIIVSVNSTIQQNNQDNTIPEVNSEVQMMETLDTENPPINSGPLRQNTTISTNLTSFENFAKSLILENPNKLMTQNENYTN